MFENKEYSREKYEEATEQAKTAKEKEGKRLKEWVIDTPQPFKGFARVFYDLRHGIDFLQGKTSEQAEKKVQKLYATSQEEANELNATYNRLTEQVVEAGNKLKETVDALRHFEEEKLGIQRKSGGKSESSEGESGK